MSQTFQRGGGKGRWKKKAFPVQVEAITSKLKGAVSKYTFSQSDTHASTHTRIHGFSTQPGSPPSFLVGLPTGRRKKTKPNRPTNKKTTPQTNTKEKKPTQQNNNKKPTQKQPKKPHPTPQESSKSNRKGAFTSEVKGWCVSSGDPRCSISLEFVKDSGRAGGTEKGRRCLRVHTYAR